MRPLADRGGHDALEKLTEARRAGLTELLDGWNPEEHPEIIAMVKDLAHALLADDERLVADAMPLPADVSGGGGRGRRGRLRRRGLRVGQLSALPAVGSRFGLRVRPQGADGVRPVRREGRQRRRGR